MEAHLAFKHAPGSAPPIGEVKSTLIVSGIQALRSRGLYDRYVELIDPAARDKIVGLIPGVWLPIGLGVEHYLAADRLQLEPRAIEGIGAEVAERINKSFLSVAVQLSKAAGATPWSALSLAHRVNDLNWRGGDLAVFKAGAKEAVYDWVGQPCAAIPYFTTSLVGYLRALTALFSDKAHARYVPERSSPTTASYRLSWL
jgi:hypothetical protein